VGNDDLCRRLLAALPGGLESVAVSRVATWSPEDVLAPLPVIEIPVVWGRTIWSLAGTACIVEQPNGLGHRETPPDHQASVTLITLPGTVVDGVPAPAITVGAGAIDVDRPAERVARRLRTRLTQIGGARPAVPNIESARFVMLFATGVDEIERLSAPDGLRVRRLERRLAEYPGGVRYEVVPGAIESEINAYAEAVTALVAPSRGAG
jgi:hypothetical protein